MFTFTIVGLSPPKYVSLQIHFFGLTEEDNPLLFNSFFMEEKYPK